ncbi:MAG: CorA family divalent cation transporter [Sulfitobacter sp.]|nr:CorA family divalent cation transporter [Sulfitobacter sp.]
MALYAYDIFPDGRAEEVNDRSLCGPGAYRWWHFDLSDPKLEPFLRQNLHEVPAASLAQLHTRPRCDPFDDGLILNLRGINMNEGMDADEMVSIRIYARQDLLITVRRNRVFAIAEIREEMLRGSAPASPAAFLEVLVDKLSDQVQSHVATIDELAETFEEALEDPDTPMPRDLPEMRRAVIRLRRYLDPQRVALGRLAQLKIPLIPEDIGLKLRELSIQAIIAVEELDELQGRMVSVQDEHDANIAQRQARHGYVLSVAAAVFLPLGFLTGLFGVNVGGMPGVDSPAAFTILCLGLLALAVLLVALLRLVRWF